MESVCNIQSIGKWKRYIGAVVMGVCGALTLAPYHMYPLLVPCFTVLYLLLYSSPSARMAFMTGWWFGLGYFVVGLYWLAHALLVEPEKFAWMIPFAVLGLPSVLALYYGVIGWLWWRLKAVMPEWLVWQWFAFVLLWCAGEYARGVLFTGFPWNYIGYSWSFSTVMIQPAWLVGIHGVNLWTVALATLPALYMLTPGSQGWQRYGVLVLMLALLVLPYSYGVWRLTNSPTRYTDTTIRLVQANIAQGQKWNPDFAKAALESHIALSKAPGVQEVDLFIWSETSYPFLLAGDASPPMLRVATVLNKNQRLIMGAITAQPTMGVTSQHWPYWNSMVVMDGEAHIVDQFDKRHLVPFGEYVPLRKYLPIEKITHGMQDFGVGKGRVRLSASDMLPAAYPLICYEAIFSGEVNADDSTQWLVNITNDAWFGMSSGPYQHMQMARMRAVENGKPLVRVANTGISLVTDSYGRILASLPLGYAGQITVKLPAAVY